MARSFSGVKAISAFVEGEISTLSRRGFAAASRSIASSVVNRGAQNMMLKKSASDDNEKTAWVPDPVTGFYRPENDGKDMDPAELRAILINNR
ncbi:hypothetical protein M569_03965, partial [Genlisea aurea]